MELSFTAGIVVLIVLYIYRDNLYLWSDNMLFKQKTQYANEKTELVKELQATEASVEALGDIPNIDEILGILDGKKPNTHKHTQNK